MLFSKIEPYVRFARFLHIDSSMRYPDYIPYDARFFLVIEGNGGIYADGRRYPLCRHDALIINSGVGYRFDTPESSVSFVAFNFDYTFAHSDLKIPIPPDRAEQFSSEKICEHIEFEDAGCLSRVLALKNVGHFLPCALNIVREYSQKLNYHEVKESKLLSELLIDAVRVNSLQKNALASSLGGAAEKLLDYIKENCRRELTNAEIGKSFGLHPNYVSSLIKSATGMPLHRYVVNLRIAYALELLESSDRTLSQIAESCGFCDIYHFSHCFKKQMGVPPSKYRCR